MADERLLDPIRRFQTPTQTEANYETLWNAFTSRTEKVTIIVGKTTEGDSAQAQVVVNSEDYLTLLDAYRARMKEIEAEDCGVTGELEGAGHVNFGNRCVSL